MSENSESYTLGLKVFTLIYMIAFAAIHWGKPIGSILVWEVIMLYIYIVLIPWIAIVVLIILIALAVA